MKRYLALVIGLALTTLIWAETPTLEEPANDSMAISADEPLDFSITLRDLHLAALNGDSRDIPGGRTFIIDAEIGSIDVLADDDTGFYAEVELIGGEWRSEKEVELYYAYAAFDGPQFRDSFSRRSETRFQPGDRILVLSRFMGIFIDYDGETPVSVIEALAYRRIP